MSENLIIFNAKIVTPLGFSARKGKEMSQLQIIENGTVEVKSVMVIIITIGTIMPVVSVYCLVLLIRIPILFLQVNVQKNSPGV